MTFFAEQVAPETSHPDTSHAGSQLGSSHLPSATHQKTYTIGFRSSQSNPAVLILDNNKSRPRRRRSTAGVTRTRRRDAAEQRRSSGLSFLFHPERGAMSRIPRREAEQVFGIRVPRRPRGGGGRGGARGVSGVSGVRRLCLARRSTHWRRDRHEGGFLSCVVCGVCCA